MTVMFTVQDWQFFQGLFGLIITVVTAAVIITIFIIRLEGRINLVQSQLTTTREELERQRLEFSEWRKLFTNAGLNAIAGSLRGNQANG